MTNLNLGLWDILGNSATCWPDKTALIQGDVKVSYSELKDKSARLASFILSKGLVKGDKAAILSPNCIEYAEAMFANARLGVVTELLNWRLAPARIAELLENSTAKILFFSVKCPLYDFLRENVKRELIYVCLDGTVEGACSCDELFALPPVSAEVEGPDFYDPAIQIYSSGTTNVPKAMLHSVKNFFLKAAIACRVGNWSSDEVYLLTSPMFHSSVTGFFTCMISGATCIIGDPSIAGIMNAITVQHATRVGVVPSVLNVLLDYLDEHPELDCSSVRAIEYGAAPMTAPQIARSMKYFKAGFYQYYGMTETAATVTALLPAHHMDESKLKSVGLPVMGTRIKVVADDGSECAVNEPGEIIVKHPCTIKEYINNPEMSATAIRGDWYYSGDIGYLDEDGFLFLVDRKNDMIITGGENVYPKEIISCIMGVKGVKDVAVTGVPDDKFGEAVMAAVVKLPDATVTEEDIINHCKENMASYKKPRYIYFVDELPLNAVGKVDKKAVKQIHFDAQ